MKSAVFSGSAAGRLACRAAEFVGFRPIVNRSPTSRRRIGTHRAARSSTVQPQWVTLGDEAASAASSSRRTEFLVAQSIAFKQFSFRLPKDLVNRVEACADNMRSRGLDVSRADVVRLLLNHALESTKCRLDQLLRPKNGGRPVRRSR
jgi:hypothetical protein